MVWSPPNLGWVKLNFDGVSKGNPGPSRVGCIVRDYKGLVLGKLAKSLPEGTNNAIEFQALLLGLDLCKELGVRRVVIEGDSTLVLML